MTPEQAGDEDDAEEADQALHPGHMSESEADEEIDHVEEKLRNDSLNPRLSRISVSLYSLVRYWCQTESATSLRTSHDKLQILQKHNDELGRKLKEAEKQLAVLGWVVNEFFADVRSENERLVEDLQEKLEETRAEIAQKRKDEKELKSKDRAQLIQIAGVSPFVASITDDSLKRIS
jgi:predicted RNase H-like nuclease (RuvC/YqgF family)